jgi:hypothetical protein
MEDELLNEAHVGRQLGGGSSVLQPARWVSRNETGKQDVARNTTSAAVHAQCAKATGHLDLLSLRLMEAGLHRLITVVATATIGQGRQLFHRSIKFSSLVRKHYGGVL